MIGSRPAKTWLLCLRPRGSRKRSRRNFSIVSLTIHFFLFFNPRETKISGKPAWHERPYAVRYFVLVLWKNSRLFLKMDFDIMNIKPRQKRFSCSWDGHHVVWPVTTGSKISLKTLHFHEITTNIKLQALSILIDVTIVFISDENHECVPIGLFIIVVSKII